jgi:hypothetical protein
METVKTKFSENKLYKHISKVGECTQKADAIFNQACILQNIYAMSVKFDDIGCSLGGNTKEIEKLINGAIPANYVLEDVFQNIINDIGDILYCLKESVEIINKGKFTVNTLGEIVD